MSVVVFLGPSLAREEACKVLARESTIFPVQWQPPCRMGDVFAAAERRPRAIVIIDGYFEQTPAVWHKEILYALKQKIPVLGGASMGALRAAELNVFGMIGVGEIYRQYIDGTLEDDDEVAVAHLPEEAGYLCRSDAMVNIRYGLKLAQEAGVIDSATQALLCEFAKREHYPQRSWQALYKAALELDVSETDITALREFIAEHKPDRKREDAVAVLQAAADWLRQGERPHTPPFSFEPTIFWEHLCNYFATVHSAENTAGVALERVVQHVRLAEPERERLRQRALLLFLVEQEVRRLALPAIDPKLALQRFRRERGLTSSQLLTDWMRAENVDREECLRLASLEESLRGLEWRYAEQINQRLPAVLKLKGVYKRTLKRVENKWHRLHEMGIEMPSEVDVEFTQVVIDWYQKTFGSIKSDDLEKHIVELGFGSPRQFLSELIAEYLYLRSEADE